jgi:hypothetical protein
VSGLRDLLVLSRPPAEGSEATVLAGPMLTLGQAHRAVARLRRRGHQQPTVVRYRPDRSNWGNSQRTGSPPFLEALAAVDA